MYVCVVVDKLNHCTAFKPRRSPGHKYTHADIQVRERGGLVTNRDSLGVPGEEELRFQETVRGQRGRSGAPRLRGPTAQGPRLLEVQGVYKNKTKQNLSNTRSRKWGPEPGAEAPSVCSQEKEPNVDLKSRIVSVWRDKLLPCLNVEVKRVDPHREKSSWDPKKKKKVPAVKQGPNVSETRGWFWWICMFVTEQQLHFTTQTCTDGNVLLTRRFHSTFHSVINVHRLSQVLFCSQTENYRNKVRICERSQIFCLQIVLTTRLDFRSQLWGKLKSEPEFPY